MAARLLRAHGCARPQDARKEVWRQQVAVQVREARYVAGA